METELKIWISNKWLIKWDGTAIGRWLFYSELCSDRYGYGHWNLLEYRIPRSTVVFFFILPHQRAGTKREHAYTQRHTEAVYLNKKKVHVTGKPIQIKNDLTQARRDGVAGIKTEAPNHLDKYSSYYIIYYSPPLWNCRKEWEPATILIINLFDGESLDLWMKLVISGNPEPFTNWNCQ